jgi:hypothetical protein
MAVYTCYAPANTATQEDLLKKKAAFDAGIGSSHWPQCLQSVKWTAMRPDGTPCPANRDGPFKRPQLNEKEFKLTGIPFISASA